MVAAPTCTILLSMTVRRSQRGGMQPCCTRNLICSAVPPEEAFVIAQAASLRVLNSAFDWRALVWYDRVARVASPG